MIIQYIIIYFGWILEMDLANILIAIRAGVITVIKKIIR